MKMEGSPMKKLHVVAGLLAALMMAVAAGCGGGSKDASKEQKVLKVGTEPTFAPFEFQEKDSKEFAGFDMDLARALGKKMGMKVGNPEYGL
jgi:glutamine transport system substrate-binding protein